MWRHTVLQGLSIKERDEKALSSAGNSCCCLGKSIRHISYLIITVQKLMHLMHWYVHMGVMT